VVQWWEARRPIYNLAVGAAGLVSLTALMVFSVLPPYPMRPGVPLLAVVVYGLLANVCYSAGPVADLLIRRRWGNQYAAVGPVCLRYGFAFAVGLTLLPVPLAALNWIARVVRLLFF
jgi:hypothetical protein